MRMHYGDKSLILDEREREVNLLYRFDEVVRSAHQNVTGHSHNRYTANEDNTLQFRKGNNWPQDPDFELYRTRSRIDLLQLACINKALKDP